MLQSIFSEDNGVKVLLGLCVLQVYYRHFNFAQILQCALDHFWGLVFLHIVLRSFLTQAKSPSQVGISRVFSVFNLSVFI